MPRRLLTALVFAVLALGPALARAEEAPGPPEDPVPPRATDEEADAALKAFKDDYRARGTQGIEKTAMREVAMRKLARTQHPEVADALYKLTRDRDADIRTLALMYLGEQRALPAYAGKLVVDALEKHASDAVFVMFAVEAIEKLDYRGAVDVVRDLLKHKDEGVQKVALLYVGDAAEWRLLDDLLARMKELKIDQGWKTEGGEVRVDTGASGDADQKAAEAAYHAKYGKTAKKARSGGRAMRDMKPVLLEAMKNLTGVDFMTGTSARTWAEENEEMIAEKKAALEKIAQEQAAAD